MLRCQSLTVAAFALGAYGLLGLIVGAVMLVVGISTYAQLTTLQTGIESQRASLVESLQTASATLHDTVGATTSVQQSLDRSRGAADQASTLANSSAGAFRDLGTRVSGVSVLGVQPLAGLGPQFDTSADQLQQLAIQLGSTRDALSQNGADVQQIAADLSQLQAQLDSASNSLNQPSALGLDAQGSAFPLELAFYGMCLLVLLQSAFSFVAGVVLWRLSRALGAQSLFPHLDAGEGVNVTGPRRATTFDDAARRGRVHVS